MNTLIAFGGILFVFAMVLYFVFIRVTTDSRVKELANLAYEVAGKIAELPAKGSPPPVNLKDGRWKTNGVSVIGSYEWTKIFGKVVWDRIFVVDNPENIWSNLVHEMTHAVRRRAGKGSSENAAEAAEAQADGMVSLEVARQLEKFK